MSEKIPVYDNILEKQPLYYHGPVERIIDECPSFHSQTLFVGKGGYLTCGCIGCSEPGIGRAMLQLRSSLDSAISRAYSAERDLAKAHEQIADLQDRAHFRDRTHRAELGTAWEMFLTISRVLREQRSSGAVAVAVEATS